jgi:hypothetical protein
MTAPISVSAPLRRSYLDWLRGVAVLIMIEAHVFDSWTRFPDNRTREFEYAIILGGFGAPLFLFLAGVIVPMSAGSKLRKSGDAIAATTAVAKRGLQIFLLAFLFRVQAWILGWADPRDLLRVDILNIMGPSMVAAAAIWGLARSTTSRAFLFGAATVATVIASPLLRVVSALAVLPDPIEAYVRPTADRLHPRCGSDEAAGAEGEHRFCHGGNRDCFHRIRGIIPRVLAARLVSSIEFLDDIGVVLFHSCWVDRCRDWRGVDVGVARRRRRQVESDAAVRAHIALHLLDSRRAGLRVLLLEPAQEPFVGLDVDRLPGVRGADAGLFDRERSRGRLVEARTHAGTSGLGRSRDHSLLIAVIGSTSAARRAGITHASADTRQSRTAALPNATG